jgi:hypothetical protein
MNDKKRFPSSGGSYTRTANGGLDQIEKPTAPPRDKRIALAEAKAKVAAKQHHSAKKVATSEKARG